MTIEVPPAATDAAAPTLSPWQRLAGIFFSPVDTLRSIAARPDILVPLLVIFVVITACCALMVPRIDFATAYRETFEARGMDMPADDLEKMVNISAAIGKGTMYAAGLMTVAWYAIVAAAVLLTTRMFGGEGTYKQAFSIVLYSAFPTMLKSIVTAIVVMARSSISALELETIVRSNPGFLVSPMEQPVAFAALAALDVFAMWTLALAIIGVAFMAKKSRLFAAGVVIGLWLIGFVAKLGTAAIGAARMKA